VGPQGFTATSSPDATQGSTKFPSPRRLPWTLKLTINLRAVSSMVRRTANWSIEQICNIENRTRVTSFLWRRPNHRTSVLLIPTHQLPPSLQLMPSILDIIHTPIWKERSKVHPFRSKFSKLIKQKLFLSNRPRISLNVRTEIRFIALAALSSRAIAHPCGNADPVIASELFHEFTEPFIFVGLKEAPVFPGT
jgi:hypothetical protein